MNEKIKKDINKAKKILIFLVNLKKGGMENQLSILLNNLTFSRYEITLVLFEDEIEFQLPENVKIIHIRQTREYSLTFLYKVYKLINSEKWDVIVSKIRNVNKIIMFLCLLSNYKNLILEIQSSGKELKPHYRLMKKYFDILKRNWIIVPNNSKAANEIKKIINKPVNIQVINNGIDSERFRPLNIKEDRFYNIGYIGRIMPVKRLETIINAMGYLKNKNVDISEFRIMFVGPCYYPHYLEKLKRLIKKKDLELYFKFYGKQDNIELYYNKLDVFVLPSEREGLSNSLLEAMSCERPCLVSTGANTEELIQKKFVFKTNDHKRLAKLLIENRKIERYLKEKITKEYRKRIVNCFSIKNLVDKHTRLWESF